nr:hypothetical protein [Tanacetum cinerariifolium]
PYAEDTSPTAQSPEYVPESDLEAYLEEDDDKDPEKDPVDYPANERDDGDDEEGSSEDDDMDIKANEEEEEEHPAPADTVVVALPTTDQAPSTEETEPFETDESDTPSSGIPPPLPISAPTLSPSLQLPSASHKEDRPEVTLPPRKRLGIALGPGYEVRESSSAAAARLAGEIRELHTPNCRRHIVTSEMLRADHRRSFEIKGLRTADRTQQQQLIQTLTVMQTLQ